MAEQAQSDADDLDGLQEVALDATQDPTDPSTNVPYAKLIQELQQPDTPRGASSGPRGQQRFRGAGTDRSSAPGTGQGP